MADVEIIEGASHREIADWLHERLTRALDGGAVATAELADLAVDQCVLVEGRFTLIAPDDYRGDTLDIALYGRRGEPVAQESLYDEDEDAE